MSSIHDHNRRAWDNLVHKNERHTKPARKADLANPMAVLDVRGWLDGSVQGKRVLCLAAGGGRQSALYAKAGAIVTVVDISPAMLEQDHQVAKDLDLDIRIVEASMDDLSVLSDSSFDVVVHPVSSCYVPDLAPVYQEVARVLEPNGIYISQHKQPTSLQAEVRPTQAGYELIHPYYQKDALPAVNNSKHREPGTLEFIHRWEELIGTLCRSGFMIEDLSEPYHGGDEIPPYGSYTHRCRYIAPYVRIKARRKAEISVADPPKMWLPNNG